MKAVEHIWPETRVEAVSSDERDWLIVGKHLSLWFDDVAELDRFDAELHDLRNRMAARS